MARRSREEMTRETADLHRAFLDALAGSVVEHTDLETKPFDVDLTPPLPTFVRLYMYSLVAGGAARPNEFKIVTRVPGQVQGEWAEFNHVEGRLTLLAGYRADFDVFVLWDASLRDRFIYATNQQVKATTVIEASATGWAEQRRPLANGIMEIVFACRPDRLPDALDARLTWTGGIARR